MRRETQAFSVVELLVVVSVIVLLLTLLAPAIDRAMAAAESAVCMTKLRNWGLAVYQYAQDNRQCAPPLYMEQNEGKLWMNFLAAYIGEPGYKIGAMRANLCPSTVLRPRLDQQVGDAHTAWTLLNAQGSYGINEWLFNFARGLSGDSTHLTGFAPAK